MRVLLLILLARRARSLWRGEIYYLHPNVKTRCRLDSHFVMTCTRAGWLVSCACENTTDCGSVIPAAGQLQGNTAEIRTVGGAGKYGKDTLGPRPITNYGKDILAIYIYGTRTCEYRYIIEISSDRSIFCINYAN